MTQELLEQTIARNEFIPQMPSPKQLIFLSLTCRDALFGGAASGGKSSALLMAALQFVHVPGYAALIVRRHFADLKLPGGLIDRSIDWLRGKAKWNAQEHKWTFKSGAVLQFGYADREGDEKRYDGSELHFVGFDEACHFTERQLVYFFERQRRTKEIPVPLRYRLATTPGGPGHEFIRRRYVKPGTPGKAFIPAFAKDNPTVNISEYEESLAEIKESNPLRYRQMLLGDWDAVPGGRFKEEWLANTWAYEAAWSGRGGVSDWAVLSRPNPVTGDYEEVERFHWRSAGTFQTYDPSASAGKDADDFCVSTWKVTPRGNVAWWACHIDKLEITPQCAVVKRLYREHRPQFIAVEEVLNQRAHAQILRESTSPHVVVRGVSPRGRKKLERALPFINLAACGRLFLPQYDPRGTPNLFPLDAVKNQLISFTGLDDGEKDDVVDTGSYMVELLPVVRPGAGAGGGRPGFQWASQKGAWSGLR